MSNERCMRHFGCVIEAVTRQTLTNVTTCRHTAFRLIKPTYYNKIRVHDTNIVQVRICRLTRIPTDYKRAIEWHRLKSPRYRTVLKRVPVQRGNNIASMFGISHSWCLRSKRYKWMRPEAMHARRIGLELLIPACMARVPVALGLFHDQRFDVSAH